MILLPAIDLYEGKVVRLTRGDYSRMTVYREDPLDQAREFEIAGAAWLHTVDLEGARDGTTPNFRVVAELCRSTGLQVEVGGGIRTLNQVEKYIDEGVRYVVIGTAAVKQ
ncbi:MAG: 1-(5-phosphoribosyl)-5-((5-phosphoribosylamino)methylideneamino)imidazole-4-carboxamide isomerase, partial [Akkermansia sp.]|nr:1-(5-phosphoribosyl)-5-((5-phosphoribosylamino)methylideneamino)imidazole-4-carboxamide isomerase [Akkermansia sp.]